MATSDASGTNFIEKVIAEDLASGRFDGRVVTRFPPEPNGYLHIGHAKSIWLNFGLAAEHAGGRCHLRFDDTNPTKETVEYVDSIMADVRWLGCDWGPHLYYASDYFQQLYDWAVQLIRAGRAYVDDQSAEEMSATRGTLTEPGRESPWRNRTVEENLDLFARMRAGEFPDGTRVLRAKIDMASPNLNLRDPTMYRIRKVAHHRTGEAWCIYPMYDFAHGQSDSIEGVTHSICTLEYEDHRPLYDWYLDQLGIYHPQQIEFARLSISHSVLSKRRLLELVEGQHVSGWDDPRMPTIAGYRRRGYTPEAIRDFCERIGVAKKDSLVETALLEHCLREDLNRRAPRAMAVLRPLRLVIENYLMRVEHPANRFIKSIVDPSRALRCIMIHDFEYDALMTMDENHYPVHSVRSKSVSFSRLRINHYLTKSNEEARAKVDRPNKWRDHVRWRSDGLEQDFPQVQDQTILKYVPAVREALKMTAARGRPSRNG